MRPSKILFLLALLSLPSFAGLGPDISRSQVPYNLCLLDFSEPSSESYSGICAGILINSTSILTAAHCIEREMPKTIRCGDDLQVVDFMPDSSSIHPQYQRDVTVNNVALPIFDIAVISLKSPVAMRPLELISFESAKEQTTENRKCGFFGFSQFMGKPKSSVDKESRGWAVSLEAMERVRNHKILQMRGLKAPGGLLQVGDSGGPLMCYKNGMWSLLGINSSRDFYARSNFMAIADMTFVNDAQAFGQIITLPTQEKQSFSRKHLNDEFKQVLKKIERLKLDTPLFSIQVQNIELALQSSQGPSKIKLALEKLEKDVIAFLLNQKNYALRLKPYSIIEIPSKPQKISIGDLNFNYFQIESFNPDKGTAIGRLRTIGPSNYFTCTGDLLCRSEVLEDVIVSISDFEIFKAEASRVFSQ